jgi:hypothetical protein
LLEVKHVIEGVPLRRHAEFEFLRRAVKPVGEFEALDVPFSLTSQIAVPGGKISDQFEDVEDRTLARSVRTANYAEGLELSFEGEETPKVVRVKPSDHGLKIVVFGRMSILPAAAMRAVGFPLRPSCMQFLLRSVFLGTNVHVAA